MVKIFYLFGAKVYLFGIDLIYPHYNFNNFKLFKTLKFLVELISNDLSYFETFVKNEIETSGVGEHKLNCLRLWIWCTKALVLREHESFSSFTKKVNKSINFNLRVIL